MQFVGIAHDRPRFRRDFVDTAPIENAGAVEIVARRPAQLHRARAPLFQRCVVEISVRISVEDLVREDRGLGRIDCDRLHRAVFDIAKNIDETVEIHRFVQTVGQRLAHEHVIGNANRSA